MDGLRHTSGQIADIVDAIAFQTCILALNASRVEQRRAAATSTDATTTGRLSLLS